MKNLKLKPFVFIILTLSILTSCVKEDDFSIPPINNVFYSQNFESTDISTLVNSEGWSNVSKNNGNRLWEVLSFGGNSYAQLSAFGSNETNMDTWLITNAINLDQTENEAFVFKYKIAFYNGVAVTVLVSDDYDGSGTADAIDSATWTNLNVPFPSYATSGFPQNFSNSITSDISSYNGDVYIAFRYVGSSASGGITSTFQIDNINVYEKN